MNNNHKTIHQKFVLYGANAKEWMRKCILLLPEIEEYRIWEQKKFNSIHEYAAKLAGMSRHTVDDALRILRHVKDKPALKRVVEVKGINAVRPVIAIANSETAGFWAEKALQMSKHTLETYVKEFEKNIDRDKESLTAAKNGQEEISWGNPKTRTGTEKTRFETQQEANQDLFAENLPAAQREIQQNTHNLLTTDNLPAPANNISAQNLPETKQTTHKKIVAMELDQDLIEELEKLKGEGSWNELMSQLLRMREEQLQSQKPEPVETESRHMPIKISRYAFELTNGTCSYPGCTKPAAIYHHTQRFALQKIHDPDRLHLLCKCHENLAHHGLIENEDSNPKTWKIRANPDKSSAKYKIDTLVQKFRKTAIPSITEAYQQPCGTDCTGPPL